MTGDAVVLVDCAATLAAARAEGWLGGRSLVVATTKYGVYACREAGVPYSLIDAFHGVDEFTNLTLATYARLEAFCGDLDRKLWTWHENLRARIRPFGGAYYELKMLVDTVGGKLFQLMRLLARTAATSVVYRRDPLAAGETGEWPFDERRNLHADLLEMTNVLAAAGATPVGLTASPGPEVPASSAATVVERVRDAVAFVPRSIRRALAATPRRRFVLFTSGGHDVKYLIPALATRGYGPVALPRATPASRAPRPPFAETWRRLSADESFVGLFSCDGVSYFPVVRSRLERLVTELAPACVDAYAATEAFVRENPIAAFSLTSFVTVSPEQRSQMDACHDAGVRVVTYQEGAGFGSVVHPMNDYGEMAYGDDLLCYGEGNLEYRDELAAAGRPVRPLHVIGSAEQDAVRARLRPRSAPELVRSITYVSTWIDANRQHHPFNGGTDSVYGEIQLTVLDALERLAPQVAVRLKPHPTDNLPDYYRAARPRSRMDVVAGVLEAALDGTDLFIIDFPSTTLLSCCQTSAHIFLLADPRMTRFSDRQLRRLERRAFVFFDTASLIDALHRLQTNGFRLGEIRCDDEYVRKYASYLGDGRSAERAAALLTEWDRK